MVAIDGRIGDFYWGIVELTSLEFTPITPLFFKGIFLVHCHASSLSI